jgi:hypothetical protein
VVRPIFSLLDSSSRVHVHRIHCFENVTGTSHPHSICGKWTDLPFDQPYSSSPPSQVMTNLSSKILTRTKCKKHSCSSTQSVTLNGSPKRPSSSSSTK